MARLTGTDFHVFQESSLTALFVLQHAITGGFFTSLFGAGRSKYRVAIRCCGKCHSILRATECETSALNTELTAFAGFARESRAAR